MNGIHKTRAVVVVSLEANLVQQDRNNMDERNIHKPNVTA
jgi:hypothetical protein